MVLQIERELRDSFFALERDVMKSFILHPDISSLLHDISHRDSQKKFLHQLQYFCNSEDERCIINSWKNIWETSIRLTLEDNNPQNMQVWHPDHDVGGMIWWWEKSQQEWWEVFWKVFTLLKKIDSDFYSELHTMIQKIVPMKTSVDVHNSCSYKNCIGTVYIGYTTNIHAPELNILEAIIHESSHNKLNLIMQEDRLFLNNKNEIYYSPYRPDARPIGWVLLWVHAIVPTVYVMLLGVKKWYITDMNWVEKLFTYHIKNKLWYNVLKKYAKLTPVWQNILSDIWSVIHLCGALVSEIQINYKIDTNILHATVKQHYTEVRKKYPYLHY